MSTGWDPSSPYQPQLPYPDALAYAYEQARVRVQVPAILLVVVGVVNLLLALVVGLLAFVSWMMPIEEYHRMLLDLQARNPGQPVPFSAEGLRTLTTGMYGGGGVVSFLVSIVILVAGLRMRTLQTYGLAMTGAILAIVPCISCSGCFGLGEVAGIWAVVVLIDPNVRMAFLAGSLPPGQYPMPMPQPQPTPQQPTPQEPAPQQPIQPTNPETPNDNIQPGGQQ